MGQRFIASAALLALAACTAGDGTNPVTTEFAGGGSTDGGISSDGTLPPGSPSPSADTSITRFEAENDNGSGYVTDVSYDSVNDEFTVDNLAFDGDNTYSRDALVGSLGSYAVYEADATANDPKSGTPITQFRHKAIYGVSKNKTKKGEAATQFAIVRTGNYINYGFGGFIYQRADGVKLPSTGQAYYAGDYAALRDFEGAGGLEYVTGDMTAAIDFSDFNTGDGVRGQVTNRRIFDTAGNDITASVLSALATKYGGKYSSLPVLNFTVGPGVMDDNGEIVGELTSYIVDGTGAAELYESGAYYAIVAGDNADEIVGILAVEGDDARIDGVTVRETGGFILYRP